MLLILYYEYVFQLCIVFLIKGYLREIEELKIFKFRIKIGKGGFVLYELYDCKIYGQDNVFWIVVVLQFIFFSKRMIIIVVSI